MPTRSISTDIWSDVRFEALRANAKLIYLRLVTGPETTPAGAIRIAPAVLGAYVGLSAKAVEQAVDELVASDLLRRYDDWLWLPKFIHYQLSGPGFITAVRRSLRGMPESLKTAADRAITAKVGPPRNGPNNGNHENQVPDKGPTRKGPSSRKKEGPTPGPTQGPTGGPTERRVRTRTRTNPEGLVSSGPLHEHDEPLGLEGPGALAGSSTNGEPRQHDEPRRVDLDAIAETSPILRAALARGRSAS